MKRKEKTEEIVTHLTENIAKLTQEVDDLSEAVEKQEQYSRSNCLLLHGIPKKN